MSKRPLAVGDRVAVYGTDKNNNSVRIVTTITKVLEDGLLYTDEAETFHPPYLDLSAVHPKQCRRLRPKQPRRRVWLVVNSYGSSWSRAYYDETLARQMPEVLGDPAATVVEYVEVRRKK